MKLKALTWGMVFAFCVAGAPLALADVDALNRQAYELHSQGKHRQAIDIARQALSEAEQQFGSSHAKTAMILNNLGNLYESLGRYEESVQMLKRALATWEETLGPEHERTARSRRSLAELYESNGRYNEALQLYKQALAISEQTMGLDDENTAEGLNRIALVYQAMSLYDEALPLLTRALAIREKSQGMDSEITAGNLNNLGVLYKAMGRYDEALPIYKRALLVMEKTKGMNHEDTATVLNNLSQLYSNMGRYDEAFVLQRRSLEIREKTLGMNHATTAISLNNLALLFQIMGRYDAALPLLRRTLAINEDHFGQGHPETGLSLNNLAELYKSMGQTDKALALQVKVLAINEKTLGPEHVRTATSLNNLANLYSSMRRFDLALPLYKRSLAIQEKVLGQGHEEWAMGLSNMAEAYESMGRYKEALALYKRAFRVVAPTDVSELQRDFGAIRTLFTVSNNLALLLQDRKDERSLDEAIFYFKLSVNASQRMRAGTRSLDANTRESFKNTVAHAYRDLSDLLIQRGRLAEAERVLLLLKESELSEYLHRNGSKGSQQQGLSWTVEEEAYRQDLNRVASEWRDFDQRRVAIMDGVKRGQFTASGPEMSELDQKRLQLDARTTNIMADATRRFVQASQQANKQREQAFDSARTGLSTKLAELRDRDDGGLRTAGLLLLPGDRSLTLIVTTEQGAVPLVRKVSEAELDVLVKSLREAIKARKDYRAPAEALYRHLIEPAEAQLAGAEPIQQWAILPFGNLRALPFAALVRPDGSHLIERYAVTMLTADGTGRLEGLETPSRETWRGVALGASQADAEFDNVALPAVRREVCGVIRDGASKDCEAGEGLISGQRYLDAAFTPAILQRMLGPDNGGAGFLHIATHFKVEKSLLLLGDGSKLTMEQILQWTPRLGQYDLIALSACDSGVSDGAVESLASVFRSKGAKAVLATLWPVADVGAAPMMVEFYRQRGEKRAMSKTAALRATQLAMIAGRIRDDSGNADLRHPYFWGSYVLMGNWL